MTTIDVYGEMFSTARSSQSNVLYLVSAGVSLWEKKMGCHVPLMCCWRTAPTAVSDASVIRQVGGHWVKGRQVVRLWLRQLK